MACCYIQPKRYNPSHSTKHVLCSSSSLNINVLLRANLTQIVYSNVLAPTGKLWPVFPPRTCGLAWHGLDSKIHHQSTKALESLSFETLTSTISICTSWEGYYTAWTFSRELFLPSVRHRMVRMEGCWCLQYCQLAEKGWPCFLSPTTPWGF